MRVRKLCPKLRVVVFDMDGVLVDVKSSWQFIHEALGKNNLENLKSYESGEITYQELIRRDIALWGHVRIEEIRNILDRVPLMPGAKQTLECLRMANLKTALISAGVSLLAERLKAVLRLDYAFANKIIADKHGFLKEEGVVTVNLHDKLKTLEKLSIAENFSLEECGAVGDSSYDVPMFRKVGLSIAFNSHEESVRKSAGIVIDRKDLREILPYVLPVQQ